MPFRRCAFAFSRGFSAVLGALLTMALMLLGVGVPASPAAAAADVTVSSLGWNIIGLDSNKVSTGPNQYPLGAKVCNTTGSPQDITGTWQWGNDTNSAYIGLASNSPVTVTRTLADEECSYLYWTVEVKRDAASYTKTRPYRVEVSYGPPTATKYAPNANGNYRTLYVERLVSQNRNTITSITGPGIGTNTQKVLVGQEYEYVVKGSTAPAGYEQSVFATLFPPSIFEIQAVTTAYSADTSSIVPNPNDQTYGDGCGWNPETRSCSGTGKVGGVMTVTYKVKVISAGTAKLQSEIYDFSGASYHYNADFGNNLLNPTVTTEPAPPVSLEVQKSATPTSFGASGDKIAYTITVSAVGGTVQNVAVQDPLLGSLSCDGTSATPTKSVVCTGEYTTTQADIERGYVDNTASATGKSGSDTLTGQDSLRVPSSAQPGIHLVKTSAVTTYAVGDVIPYSFEVTNTGGLPLTDVAVTDPMLLEPVICAQTTLQPGAKTTCTADYTATQADVDAGAILNSATAIGLPPSGIPVSSTDDLRIIGPAATPQADVVKSSPTPDFSVEGDVIRYEFVVTNTGNITLNSVGIADARLDAPAVCASDVLAPGDSTTCFGSYTTTPADVTASQVINTATAIATPERGTLTAPESNEVTVPKAEPSIDVVKSQTPATFGAVGDEVSYTVVVTNDGTASLTNVVISDQYVDLSCDSDPEPWATGDGATCTGVHIVTQEDIDNGYFTNVASASADSAGGTVEDEDSVSATGPEAAPGMAITKTAVSPSYSIAGDVIDYQFEVRNTGNVTLSSVTILDPMLDAPPGADCPVTDLAPGQQTTCTGQHTVTEAEASQAFVSNIATASAEPSRGVLPEVEPSTADVPRTAAALEVTKTASPTSFVLGDDIEFTVTARNRGTAAITGFTLTDSDDRVTFSGEGCTFPRTLAPETTLTCTGTITANQSDVDNGQIINVARGEGVDAANGQDLFDVDQAVVEGPAPVPALTIAKSGTKTYTKVGDKIDYTFTVKNTGNVTISDVEVLDPSLDNPAVCTKTTLAPQEQTTCTGRHVVTTADVTEKKVVNTASVTGSPAAGLLDPPDEATETSVLQSPSLSVTKTVKSGADPAPEVGDTIEYDIVVTNDGDLALSKVVVTDVKADADSLVCDPVGATSAPGVDLAVDAQITCTASHTVTQAEMDGDSTFTNKAKAAGEDPSGDPVEDSDAVDTPLADAAPALTVVKDAQEDAVYGTGEVIHYSFTVKNMGNVTMADVTVDDPMFTVSCGADPVDLAPGEEATCTGEYEVTADDVTAGKVVNQATADGNPARGTFDKATSNEVTVPVLIGELTVVKEVTGGADPAPQAGGTITYSITVTNTGDAPLSGVTVVDPDVSDLTCDPAEATSETGVDLAVDAQITCTASHTISQGEFDDESSFTNTAGASGEDPSGNPFEDTDVVTTPFAPKNPAIEVQKSADVKDFQTAGQKIDFSFEVTNTGNVTLADLTISDPLLSEAPICPVTQLAPAEKTTCTGTYTTTQQDVTRRTLTNTAVASAKSPDQEPVSGQGSVTVPGPGPAPAEADLRLTKTASGPVQVGSKATFTLVVSNAGPATASDVVVSDPLPAGLKLVSATGDGWTCSVSDGRVLCSLKAPLASGEKAPAISIVVKALAASRPSVVNTATASSSNPDPTPDDATASSKLVVGKLPQEPRTAVKAERNPGSLVLKTGTEKTNAAQKYRTRVSCRPLSASVLGEASYCKVTKKAGRIQVRVVGDTPVRVRVVYWAPATDTYRRYRSVDRYIVRPKG